MFDEVDASVIPNFRRFLARFRDRRRITENNDFFKLARPMH